MRNSTQLRHPFFERKLVATAQVKAANVFQTATGLSLLMPRSKWVAVEPASQTAPHVNIGCASRELLPSGHRAER